VRGDGEVLDAEQPGKPGISDGRAGYQELVRVDSRVAPVATIAVFVHFRLYVNVKGGRFPGAFDEA